jgi:co-chaperonin GroES (HSP10)
MPAVAMLHEEDPREVILKRVGDLSGVEVFGSRMLVVIYKRPEKTKSGLILTDSTRTEDIHQGKVGLIIKMGPFCYVDEDGNKYRDINVGDWVVFRPSDGWRVTLNTLQKSVSKDDTVDCRLLSDGNVDIRITEPDYVY